MRIRKAKRRPKPICPFCLHGVLKGVKGSYGLKADPVYEGVMLTTYKLQCECCGVRIRKKARNK